jgi:hypothetical protein
VSADPRHESAQLASFFPQADPGTAWQGDAPEIQRTGAYVEPGGMVDIALRELGARLISITPQDGTPSRTAGLCSEAADDVAPDVAFHSDSAAGHSSLEPPQEDNP